MKSPTRLPEIHIKLATLEDNPYVEKVVTLDDGYYHVYYDHPVLGETLEIYRNEVDDFLSLKAIYPSDMQEPEEIEVCKDYYNNYILGGHDTYIDYYRQDTGWYLLTTNDIGDIQIMP